MDDSVTYVMGDLVTVNTDGHAAFITNSDEKIAGVVIGFVGKHGQSLNFDSGYEDRFTSASDNTTSAANEVIIDAGREIEIQIDADASLAQTNLFQYFNLNNSYQVDVYKLLLKQI